MSSAAPSAVRRRRAGNPPRHRSGGNSLAPRPGALVRSPNTPTRRED
ncbi:hypothetical protein [Brachybacterium sacelli]